MNACDPDADIENLRKLIKLNTGVDIKLTKKEICNAYQDIQDGKLPLPPMVMNSSRTYLVDKKSPLKPNDYEQLFDASTKRADLKRIARKVDLKNVEQMTKSQIVDAIGKRLRYMKVHEPVKFARRRQVVSVNNNVNTAVNNTAVNVNNTNVNRVNNVGRTNNTNVNRVNNVGRTNNTNVNRVNTNFNTGRTNTNMNRVNTNFNAGRTNTNMNRVNTNFNAGRTNTNVNRVNRQTKVNFPTGGLFKKSGQPKFLGGTTNTVKKNKGFFAGLFGKKNNKNYIAANKFKGSKEGYVFRKGEKGLGYYLNIGRVQGPQLPSANITRPIPANEDFALELAVARVKQLGLKREKKFLNQIQLGTKKRKQVVIEAEQFKEEESQFLAFLDQLDISNTNRNSFKQRMATDDFGQIKVEAQIKADEKANVARTSEEKMGMFLKTTGLTNANKQLFINKARKEGSNINALIEEARKLNANIKGQKVEKKRDEFRKILQNYNKLSNSDKDALVQEVGANANANTMRQMADKLVQKRIEEKKNATAQNLLSFLTPLEINQKNKDEFLRRFKNEGANINSIKTEALKLQESKGSANVEALRVRLNTRLGEIGLNQVNKNAIMKKFRNGNRNVNKLIEEAKVLKTQRGVASLNEAKKDYRAYINGLPGLTNADKAELTKNNGMNRNRAKQMSNKRLQNMKIESKQGFINFMTELGITNQYRNELLSDFNSNSMTMNALKNKATRVAQQIRNKKNSELKTRLNTRLGEIGLNQVNKNIIMKKFTNGEKNVNKLLQEAKSLKSGRNAEKLNTKRKEFVAFLNSLPGLTNEDKADLLKNTAMNRSRAKQMSNKRLQNMKIESKQGFINFMTELGITNQYRNELLNDFNANSMTMNALKNKATKVAQQIKNKKNSELKTQLNTRLGEIGLSQVNKNSIMKKFANGEKNVNKLLQEAKSLKSGRNAEKLDTKRKEFVAFLNSLPGLTNEDKADLLKNNGMNRNRAKRVSNKRLQNAKIESKQGFIKFMSELGITNQYRNDLLDDFNANSMTMNALKNKATRVAQQIRNKKNSELKTRLNTRLGEIGLNQVNKNAIMKKFTNGEKNVNKLLQEAKNVKSMRNAEILNTKRKEYSAFLNTLKGLTLDDKAKLMSNNGMNRNKAKVLSNQRLSNQKGIEKAQFEKFLVNLGLNNGDRKTMLNKYNSNSLTVNALQKVAQELKAERVQQQKAVNKKTLMEYLEKMNIPRNTKINIERRFNANQANLKTLQSEVNKIVKNARNAKLADNKAAFTSNVQASILSGADKNALIRSLDVGNVNITALRNKLNTMVKKMVETQRAKDRDELEEYMKSQGVSVENQKTVLSKFNVNSKIALTNLKQEANAILASRVQEKREANTAVLTNRAKQLGLTNQETKNLTNKLNREKLESLMNEANAIAKRKAQNKKNQIEREKSNYINKLGLNANNKRNILAQNLNFNSTKALANQTLQKRIAERRAKNMTKLNLHLNKLNLNNQEKRKFYNNFNRNVNLNTIMKNATNFEAKKKANIKSAQLEDLKKFLNQQGLNGGEQRQFINRLNKNQDDLAALKVEAKKFMDEKFKQLKAKKRGELVNVLKGLSNLTQNDINGILKNFDNTNVNGNVLKKRAQEINKSRKDERYAQSEEEFYGYLNTLQNLTPENRTEITAKLNGYFTNWNAIKQLATNTAVGRAKERRAAEKADLNNYMTNMGFNNNSKRIFFKDLDDGKYIKNVKANAAAYKKDLDAKRKATARKGFANLLNTLYLNKSDQNALLEQFNDETTGLNQLQNKARAKEANTIERNRGKLTLYLSDELKLNSSDVNLLVKNYNADPRSLNTLRNRGRQLKNARNEEERKEIRRQVKEYLNGLNLLNNKNKQNIINKNLPYNNAKAEGNKAQEFKRMAKRDAGREKLVNAVKNLSNADQKNLLNKFNTRNVTLNSMLNEAKDLKTKRATEKRARERNELYNALNGLNMNVADRNTIMNKFNKSNATVNALRNEAVKLKNQRVAQKRAQNRGEIESILNETNLSASNKSGILNKFNANKNQTLNSMRVMIKELSSQRKVEKRLANRVEVEKYLQKVGLSNSDTKTVLNRFNANTSISLKDASNEANALLIRRVQEKTAANRAKLVEHMNGLNITNANRAAILKNFDSEAASLNNLKTRATNINTAVKAKAAQRRELSNYINSLNVNGKDLLNKFNNGRSTLNSLKKEANKRRTEANAKLVNNKKKELNAFMNDTFIPKANRKAFLNRITANTNMNAIKSNVKNMNSGIRAQKEKEAKNRDEFATFLNGLELTGKEKEDLLKNYNAGKTNKNALRNKAVSINAAVKAKAAQRKELSNYINSLNVNGKNLLNKFNNGRSTLNSLKKEANKRRTEANAKLVNNKRKELNAFMNDTFIPKANRKAFLNRITVNTNMNAIKSNVKNMNNGIRAQKEKEAKNRDEFSTFLNGLELTGKEKEDLLKNYNAGKTNKNALRNKAVSINAAVKAKAAQRQELSNYINSLNVNGKNLLNKFNNGTSTLNSLKKKVNKRRTEANAKIVNNKRKELNTFMSNTLIPKANRQAFLNRITVNTNMNAIKSNVKNVDNGIRAQKEKEAKNRDEFSTFLNGLELTNKEKTDLLKNYNAGKTNKNVIRNKALSINAAVKAKAAQRQELSNYMNSLGINGKAILNKFNNGRSSLDKLKKEADKLKSLSDAKIVKNKRDDIRAFMKETRLPNSNKNSFVNRIEVNTNMNTIKREIKELNSVLKSRNDELARKKTELSTYLNGLNDLTSNQRSSLLRKVVNANTNIQPLKNEGTRLNKNVKNKRAEQKRLEEEKRIKEAEAKKALNQKKFENHLRGLKHLTSKEMEGYAKNLANGKATLEDLIAVSKAKNADNEKDKDAVRNYVRRASIPQTKKNVYLKQLNTPYVNITPIKGLVNANVETQKRELQKLIREAEAKLKKLSNVTADEKAKFKNRFKMESIDDVLKEAEKLNANRKGVRKARNQEKKNVAAKLQALTSLERNNRKKLMNRLATNGANKVVANAQALNKERKNAKAEEEARKKAEEEARKKAEETKKARNQQTKNVAAKLQALTSLKRENRKTFMNRLATNGAQKVVANAQALNKQRKDKQEAEKRMIEDRRKAEEARKKAEGAKKKLGNLQTRKLATRLQGLTSLKRENRKKFMNRLEQNGFSRVLGNAQALDKQKKQNEESTRRGIEWKLKKIGVKGANLQTLLKRWNNSKNTTIWADARKIVEESMKKQPLLDKIVREIPGTFGQWRRGWEDAVRKATTPQELQRLDRLLDEKSKLRKEIEKAPIAEDKRRGQLRFVMKMANDVGKRREELARDIKAKRDMGDRATKETATKLQSLDRLGRDNRKRFMNRISGGEDSKTVLRNAEKLQRDRLAKQRLEAERKERERQQSQQRKEREQKTREYERQKQGKLRANTAKMLQGMSGLERSNRKEFMNRLQRGNDPAKIISNARMRDASKRPKTGPQPKPQGRVAPRTKKMKAKNRTRAQIAKQQQRRRR
jgi:hypothetical protein